MSLDRLRHSLGVLAARAGDGIPVSPPLTTSAGSLVVEAGPSNDAMSRMRSIPMLADGP
ncbi:hypothetical protein [Streptomyces sp. NPDC017435]|uniref:hypothetical protein n=1 Tax=Streptomyces sp. NPDC017435 TaxID=3364995 RepID=UPI00378EF921